MMTEHAYISNAVRALGDRLADDTPADGFGPGYLAYSIRSDFRDLCRFIGKEAARQEVAEIINAEFERKVIDHV